MASAWAFSKVPAAIHWWPTGGPLVACIHRRGKLAVAEIRRVEPDERMTTSFFV